MNKHKDVMILLGLLEININSHLECWDKEIEKGGVPLDISTLKELLSYVRNNIDRKANISYNRVDNIVKDIYSYNKILINREEKGVYVYLPEEVKTIDKVLMDSYFSFKLTFMFIQDKFSKTLDKYHIDLKQYEQGVNDYIQAFEREIVLTKFKASRNEVIGKQNIFKLSVDNI